MCIRLRIDFGMYYILSILRYIHCSHFLYLKDLMSTLLSWLKVGFIYQLELISLTGMRTGWLYFDSFWFIMALIRSNSKVKCDSFWFHHYLVVNSWPWCLVNINNNICLVHLIRDSNSLHCQAPIYTYLNEISKWQLTIIDHANWLFRTYLPIHVIH